MLAIKIRKLVAENISISLLPIVSAKKSLDLLSLLLFPLPPTYECILSLSDETISSKINNILLMSIYLLIIYLAEDCTGVCDGSGEDCQPPGYKSEPPLHWDSSSCDLVYL